MAADNVKKLRLYEDYWNEQGMTDENSLSNALLTQPDVLSPVITHLAGREDKRFPLSFLTEGIGNVKYTQDIEYDYPVMGRAKKAVQGMALTQGDGSNFSTFKAVFAEKYFVKNYLVENPGGSIQARIVDDGSEVATGWEYTMQLVTTSKADTIASTDIIGEMWTQLFAPNAFSGSRGNESIWVAPSKYRNQKTLIRKSYRYEGNAPNRVVIYQMNIGGKLTNLWQDFEEYQHMLSWKEEHEALNWYSVYNRDSNGVIHLKDDNGKPIPIGAGALDQIPNYDTYSDLTASKIKGIVRDALFGATDAQKMNIVLFSGLGGLEEFDDAMKDEVAGGNYIKNTDPSSFITGTGRNLMLGGFFTSYQHIDGHVVTVRHLPLFDNGPRALNSNLHPVTGLPLESYRMVFLDMSVYDGEPNVQMVTTRGREMVRWAVAGASVPKGFQGNGTRATDVDGASVHFLKESGIAIRRATNCLHLECVKS